MKADLNDCVFALLTGYRTVATTVDAHGAVALPEKEPEMHLKHRRALLAAGLTLLAWVVVAGAAFAATGVDRVTKTNRRAATSTTVDVPADTIDWFVDTHIALTANELFSVSATGTANWDYTHPAVGPLGLKFTKAPCAQNQYADPSSWASAGLNCFSLVGRIGGGPVFLVGSTFKLKSPVAGELYLGFNDDYPYDNSGDFTATVTTP